MLVFEKAIEEMENTVDFLESRVDDAREDPSEYGPYTEWEKKLEQAKAILESMRTLNNEISNM